MKSSKCVPKWKPKSEIPHNKSADSKIPRAGSNTSSGEVRNASTTEKLVDGVTGNVKPAPMTEQTYASFMSGISDCSSCDQQRHTKAVDLKLVEEDCENILQQFTNTFSQIGRLLTNGDDARQIGIRCLEYANVVSFSLEKLERERSAAVDRRTELDLNITKLRQDKVDLQNETCSMQQINTNLNYENRRMFNELNAQNGQLDLIREKNRHYRSVIEDQKSTIKAELEKVADNTVRVEKAVVDKEIRWDNLNFHLENRVAELKRDRDQLTTNYDLMCNALRVRNDGDVDNELMMDIGVLEAGHEAEMVMIKYAHESFISELNKSNCKLWNEKFYKRGRLEEEINKNELYTSWLVALQQENYKRRDEISHLNSQIERLLDDICSKLENVTTG